MPIESQTKACSTTSGAPAGPPIWLRRLALFALFGALYLLSMPTHVPDSGDAVAEASRVTAASSRARSNHLLQTPVMRAALGVGQRLGYDGPPFLILQTVNAVSGAAVVVCVATIAESIGLGAYVAALAAALVGVSFGQWYHSREAETTMLANLLWLVSLSMAFQGKSLPWVGRSVVAGVTGGLSALFCLNVALLLPATLVALVARDSTCQRRWCWAGAGVAACCMAVVGGTPLLVAGLLNATAPGYGLKGAMHWITTYPDVARLDVGTISPHALLRSAAGLAHALVGEDLRSASSALRKAAQVATVVGALALFAHGARSGCRIPSLRVPLLVCAAGLLLNFVFSTLWLGSDPQFWVPALPLFWLVAVMGVAGPGMGRRALRVTSVLSVVLLAALNWHSEVPSTLFPRGGADYGRAMAYQERATANDLLLVAGSKWALHVGYEKRSKRALNYLYSGRVSQEEYLSTVSHLIRSTHERGGRVYIAGVLEPQPDPLHRGAWKEISRLSGLSRDEFRAWLLEEHEVTLAFKAQDIDIWEVCERSDAPGRPSRPSP